ncbi:uncharacterized protein DNG_06011 [Cephalotrichum gorgonifer]|uniref:diphosphoinositol-polyphosphate diphosphatase n=1 Tax=Cephalotrichum gorgonifer TaxID=2041049 RepID=A0AAE8SW82_9PEZI|nr:uncharacterized protein DNG_06011 [Cephalotrichum gorgonifer]
MDMDNTTELQPTPQKMDGLSLRARGGSKMEEDESRNGQDSKKSTKGSKSTQGEESRTMTPVASEPPSRLANFGVVTTGIYRSAWPTAEGYKFLQSLKVKTIVTLVVKDEPDTEYEAFIDENGIKQYVFDIEGTKKQSIPASTMRDVLQLVLDKSNHPVLIHCNRGRHRTGSVVGVIRKLYGWDLSTVLAEYHSFASPKPREADISYLTDVEPRELLAQPYPVATFHRNGAFPRFFAITFFAGLVWLVSFYKITYVVPDTQADI